MFWSIVCKILLILYLLLFFVTMIICVRQCTQTIDSMRFVILWHRHLHCCVFWSTIFIGMQNKHSQFDGHPTSYFPPFQYESCTYQYGWNEKTGGWRIEVRVIWEEHRRRVQQFKADGFLQEKLDWVAGRISRLEVKKREYTYADDERRRIFESRPLHAWGGRVNCKVYHEIYSSPRSLSEVLLWFGAWDRSDSRY